MLELRPVCENCAKPLPPSSTEAWICSFECSFCYDCAKGILGNVCPNCGGGFEKRPGRPVHNWKNDNTVGAHPPSQVIKHRPVDLKRHKQFAADIVFISSDKR